MTPEQARQWEFAEAFEIVRLVMPLLARAHRRENPRMIAAAEEMLSARIAAALLAVRGEALEEAAQVAETTNVCGGPNGQPIARAIRALARSAALPLADPLEEKE